MVTQQILVLSFQVRALVGLFSDLAESRNHPQNPVKHCVLRGSSFLRVCQFSPFRVPCVPPGVPPIHWVLNSFQYPNWPPILQASGSPPFRSVYQSSASSVFERRFQNARSMPRQHAQGTFPSVPFPELPAGSETALATEPPRPA